MNKRMIWIFAAFAAIVVLVVLACAVFVVGDVSVRSASGAEFTAEEREKILADSEILRFSSIFSVSTEKAARNIEKKNPYFQVLRIERRFPNRIVIDAARREAVFAVSDGADGFFLLDADLKLLAREQAPVSSFLCRIGGWTPEGLSVGDFADMPWLAQLARGAAEASFIGARFGTFIRTLTFDSSTAYLTTNTGVVLALYTTGDVGELFSRAYNFYLTVATAEQRLSGFIALSQEGWRWSASYPV